MTFNPLVSIVIPVYNGANYLREAIDSALGQTYAPCEVIVVNDGSTDNGQTEQVALSYGDKIRYFTKANGGTGSALNLGISKMTGDYFSWLSHDDLYTPDKVAAQIAYVADMALEGCVVYSDFTIVNANGEVEHVMTMPSPAPEAVFEYLYTQGQLHGCTLLIPRRGLLEAGGFPEDKAITQDYEFWLRLCRICPFVRIPQQLVIGRNHPERATIRLTNKRAKELRQFIVDHLLELLVYGRTPWQPRIGNENILLRKAMWACLMKDQPLMVWHVCAIRLIRVSGGQNRLQSLIECLQSLMGYYSRKAFARLNHPLLNKLFPSYTVPIWKWAKNNMAGPAVGLNENARLDFIQTYHNNVFAGTGSSQFQTRVLRKELPRIVQQYGIRSLLDAPCGDFNWMRRTNLEGVRYIGADIVPDLIYRNKLYESEHIAFQVADIRVDQLPMADAVFCRDCLVHLPYADIYAALNNFRRSGHKYLLTTVFPNMNENHDLGEPYPAPFVFPRWWRPINFILSPFNFPQPIELIDEKNTAGIGPIGHKCLALWKIADLPLQ